MSWLSRHAPAIESGAAAVTALAAVLALVGVSLQLRAAESTSRGQSARESYANFLALSVNTPEFSQPLDSCALLAGPKAGAYRAYVDYLLYAAEQMISVETGWETTFYNALDPHLVYICATPDLVLETDALADMLLQIRQSRCAAVTACELPEGD